MPSLASCYRFLVGLDRQRMAHHEFSLTNGVSLRCKFKAKSLARSKEADNIQAARPDNVLYNLATRLVLDTRDGEFWNERCAV